MGEKILVYQLYPIVWSGIREMTTFLPRIKALGADYVWLSPIYPSPRYDMGYDVADYYNVDSRLGTMEDFDEFVRTAHAFGIKVLMDLVLNHTSVEHAWFHSRPEYYIWHKYGRPGWQNLFDGRSAWTYYERSEKYYCYLFHEKQADLNWFPSGVLNRALVEEFKLIIAFWMRVHDVDGFRIDAPQALNKRLNQEELVLGDFLTGKNAASVINMLSHAVNKKTPFMIMECLDPTFGSVVDYYTKETDVDLIFNIMLKATATSGDLRSFRSKLQRHLQNPRFALDLESHDSPRFTSRTGLTGDVISKSMFDSGVQAVCLYQGQELGLQNPTPRQLSDIEMLALDAEAAMRFSAGASLSSLREISRANARVRLPMDKYARQEQDPDSVLEKIKRDIKAWKCNN